jgi:hypothetical protein
VRTAHDVLDELRQHTETARTQARDLEVALHTAEADAARAAERIIDAHADEDQRAVARAREAEDHHTAQVHDLTQRVAGAQIRVQRAQQQLESFERDNAKALIDERVPVARELALHLTRTGHDLVRLHRGYLEMRTEVDRLVGAVPGAVPRSDGPPAAYPWEREITALAHADRETPEVTAPLPQWRGLEYRQQEDAAARLLKAQREGAHARGVASPMADRS